MTRNELGKVLDCIKNDYCGYTLYFTDTDSNKCETLDSVYMNWEEVKIGLGK